VRFILPRTLLHHLSKSTSYAAPRGGLPEQL
jgi:hypothetical protein